MDGETSLTHSNRPSICEAGIIRQIGDFNRDTSRPTRFRFSQRQNKRISAHIPGHGYCGVWQTKERRQTWSLTTKLHDLKSSASLSLCSLFFWTNGFENPPPSGSGPSSRARKVGRGWKSVEKLSTWSMKMQMPLIDRRLQFGACLQVDLAHDWWKTFHNGRGCVR